MKSVNGAVIFLIVASIIAITYTILNNMWVSTGLDNINNKSKILFGSLQLFVNISLFTTILCTKVVDDVVVIYAATLALLLILQSIISIIFICSGIVGIKNETHNSTT